MSKYLLAACTAWALAATAGAETPQEAAIRRTVEPRMGQNVKIDSVTKQPYGGLYEIRVGSDIFYTEETGRYLFVGKVVDLSTLKDLTAARVDQLNRVPFASLPLDAAIKAVKGDGSRVIAVFEDPNCTYCRKLRQTLAGIDNITIYTFLLNILADDSAAKSAAIWCAPDRAKAWDDWMLRNVMPASTTPCRTPDEEVKALGRKLRVAGTPTIIFADGSRVSAALDAQALEAKLAAAH